MPLKETSTTKQNVPLDKGFTKGRGNQDAVKEENAKHLNHKLITSMSGDEAAGHIKEYLEDHSLQNKGGRPVVDSAVVKYLMRDNEMYQKYKNAMAVLAEVTPGMRLRAEIIGRVQGMLDYETAMREAKKETSTVKHDSKAKSAIIADQVTQLADKDTQLEAALSEKENALAEAAIMNSAILQIMEGRQSRAQA